MVERYKYKCIDAYEEPENPMEWLPCPRCGLRPLVWEFDNGRATACGCGTDCYTHWSVQAVACQTVIRNDICSKCCFVDTNICSNMRCFSSVREDDKSVIFKKIEL